MATYAEYQQQTMASSNNDFTLFPYDFSQDQTFITTTSYPDQSYLQSTTFESSFPQQAFSHPMPEQYQFEAPQQHVRQEKLGMRSQSPRQSPTNSASHSFDYTQPAFFSSTSDSGASVPSTISSAMASPMVQPQQANEWSLQQQQQINIFPNIIQGDETFATTGLDFESIPVMDTKGCVDPSLIQPFSPSFTGAQFPDTQAVQSPQHMPYPQPPSPAPSGKSARSSRPGNSRQHWQPYQTYPTSRRQSVSSVHSRHSQQSISSDDSNKGLCPIPTCGRHFKDLKAHMLTHQETRPEKCPIPTCEYHIKGFARKYDKNRHTLTHYKGTMVCGFCPGSGSAAEKSFNRADVFKRHLTSVHGVEQTPPNARRKSPSSNVKRTGYAVRETSGMCSTCGNAFANPQDFYEHLDDCVLRVVQQADPSEAVNEKLLSSIADDANVQETLERHMLPGALDFSAPTSFDDDEEAEDDEDGEDEDNTHEATSCGRNTKSGKAALKSRKLAGNASS